MLRRWLHRCLIPREDALQLPQRLRRQPRQDISGDDGTVQGDEMALAVHIEQQAGKVATAHKDFWMGRNHGCIEIGQQAL